MELTNMFPYVVGLLALAFVLLVAQGLTMGAWKTDILQATWLCSINSLMAKILGHQRSFFPNGATYVGACLSRWQVIWHWCYRPAGIFQSKQL